MYSFMTPIEQHANKLQQFLIHQNILKGKCNEIATILHLEMLNRVFIRGKITNLVTTSQCSAMVFNFFARTSHILYAVDSISDIHLRGSLKSDISTWIIAMGIKL